jgi:hypothetical protein
MVVDSRYNSNFLFFEEEKHRYTDSIGNEYLSVTTLIGNYYPKFDANYWAHKKAKEQGKSEKAIKAEWDKIRNEACERGTHKHNGIEDAIKETSQFKNAIKYLTEISSGRCVTVADIPNLIPKPLDVEKFKEATNYKYEEIYRVFDYYTQRGYTIYSEIGMYLIDYRVSGTIDILCIRDTDFVILDWKTNREGLKFESGYYKKDKSTHPAQVTDEWVRKKEYMLPPLGNLENCNGSVYTMQLSTYALGTELILGIPCVGLGLCHIASPFIKNKYGQPYRDENNQYPIDPNGKETVQWYRIKYLRKEAAAILNDRRMQIAAENKNKELSLF